ncbi:MAG: hypothetical protein BZY88_18790 [SAR202 cluster bacterium Io17-Chloro-G9]|nr:MAG: hypothetical protein BZY88_18790 [SAR202 cluster bacterium Io17-Chloro-G9]
MPFQVLVHREAIKALLDLPSEVYPRIYQEIIQLEHEPRSRRASKLKGQEDIWRVRVGRYRLIFHVDDPGLTVTVLRIALRTERTYRGL